MGIIPKICGKSVDIIRYFKYHVLVQEVDSKQIYLVEYDKFDPAPGVSYNRDLAEVSNVISLDWVRRCRKKKQKVQKLAETQ